MSIAPFIKPIRVQGGTFYTFSSAAEDLGFSFNNDEKKFRFSNYVLLNIPPIKTAVGNENFIQLDAIPGGFHIDGSKSWNTYLAESFQNYCLNLETLITSDKNYNADTDRTVSERVFFKWLKEIGAIRFREANGNELSSPVFGVRYTEEDESPIYKRVVQYIGEIDMLNNVRNNNNAYSEIYIHLPSSHGKQPYILFNSIEDENYYPNAEFTYRPQDASMEPYIYGRKATDTHPAGLEFEAYYDSELSTYGAEDGAGGFADFEYWHPQLQSWVPETHQDFYWWYPAPKANTYFLEKNTFNDPTNDKFRIVGNKTVEFVRSRLDGISIEFNEKAYTAIAANPDLNTFGELAESGLSSNFEFNACLIYYELYDAANPENSTKNLFGVLFFDNVENLPGGGGHIPTFPKYKPNPVTGDNGNAYSFKINLKFDVTSEDAAIETIINDYNTFSLELYLDALNELKESTKLLLKNSEKLNKLENLIHETRGLVLDSLHAEKIEHRLNEIEKTLKETNAFSLDVNNVLKLIERNYTEIKNIYENKTSLEVAYNLNVIKSGSGLEIDRTSDQFIKISAKNQNYNLSNNSRISIQKDFDLNTNNYSYIYNLIEYTNYIRITDGSTGFPFAPDRDIVIYINDYPVTWQKGQRLRISFSHGLLMNNTNGKFNLIIYSDSKDKLNTGYPYSAEIGIVTWEMFQAKNNKPIIDLICFDAANYDFEIDII